VLVKYLRALPSLGLPFFLPSALLLLNIMIPMADHTALNTIAAKNLAKNDNYDAGATPLQSPLFLCDE